MSYIFANSKFNGDTNEFIKVSAYFNKFLNKLNNLFKQCGHNYVLSSTKQLWRSSFFLKVVSLSQKNDSDINKKCDFLFSKWNTSNVTNMNIMFYDSFFNNNSISNWDVSNLIYMKSMFEESEFNDDLSKWNTSNVKIMTYLFANANFNNNSISNWNTSSVINMNSMFYNSLFNGDLSNWNVSNVQDMKSMFEHSLFNGDISKWKFNKDVYCKFIIYENTNFIEKYNYGREISCFTNDFLQWLEENRMKMKNLNVSKDELIDIDNYLISFNNNINEIR